MANMSHTQLDNLAVQEAEARALARRNRLTIRNLAAQRRRLVAQLRKERHGEMGAMIETVLGDISVEAMRAHCLKLLAHATRNGHAAPIHTAPAEGVEVAH